MPKIKISRKEFEEIMKDLRESIPGLGGRVYKEKDIVVDFLLVRRILERYFEIAEDKGGENGETEKKMQTGKQDFIRRRPIGRS
jgi:hypothetical protein